MVDRPPPTGALGARVSLEVLLQLVIIACQVAVIIELRKHRHDHG
jgi:hypothetical protein